MSFKKVGKSLKARPPPQEREEKASQEGEEKVKLPAGGIGMGRNNPIQPVYYESKLRNSSSSSPSSSLFSSSPTSKGPTTNLVASWNSKASNSNYNSNSGSGSKLTSSKKSSAEDTPNPSKLVTSNLKPAVIGDAVTSQKILTPPIALLSKTEAPSLSAPKMNLELTEKEKEKVEKMKLMEMEKEKEKEKEREKEKLKRMQRELEKEKGKLQKEKEKEKEKDQRPNFDSPRKKAPMAVPKEEETNYNTKRPPSPSISDERGSSISSGEFRPLPIPDEPLDVSVGTNRFNTKPFLDWNVEEVAYWLNDLHMCRDIIQNFQTERISGRSLAELSKEDLRSLGAKLGDVKIFERELELLKHPSKHTSGNEGETNCISELESDINYSDVTMERRIGEGYFGEVFLAEYLGSKCAVKTINSRAFDSPSELSAFLQEARLMKSLIHSHIVQTLGVVVTSSSSSESREDCLIVMEYCDRGSLLEYLRENDSKLSTKERLLFAQHIALGLRYLKSRSIIHRDLACRNVLVAGNNACKISDFGMSRSYPGDYYKSRCRSLPIKWAALEAIKFQRFTPQSDVWSYGVVLFEIFSAGESPYAALDNTKTYEYVRDGGRLPKPRNCPPRVYDEIMFPCWNENPQERITIEQIFDKLNSLVALDEILNYNPQSQQILERERERARERWLREEERRKIEEEFRRSPPPRAKKEGLRKPDSLENSESFDLDVSNIAENSNNGPDFADILPDLSKVPPKHYDLHEEDEDNDEEEDKPLRKEKEKEKPKDSYAKLAAPAKEAAPSKKAKKGKARK